MGNWRRQWHPTPVPLPGKSHGWRSLVGCSPWSHKESDTTERLHFHFSLSCIGEGNGNPLQCSCLENPRDGGAWWAAIYGVAQSRTRLKQLSSGSSSSRWKIMFAGMPSLKAVLILTSSYLYTVLFIQFMGFSQQEYWNGLPFPPPVEHILSEVSTMTCLSWVALHGTAHRFIDFLKEINPEYSLEGLMLKQKFNIWSTNANIWLTEKDSDAWKG